MSILCQLCKQSAATVHMTDIQPTGEHAERHLCESCAAKEGLSMQSQEPVQTMLEKFVKLGADMQEAAQRSCPECGQTFGEFRQDGLLGCAHDYEVFRDLLVPLIERAHGGSSEHAGKRPGQSGQQSVERLRIIGLRKALDTAVAEEDYEEAARLRDELKSLETGDGG